jgi:preprotein translocase subunit SecY
VKDLFRNIWKIEELRKRLLFTFFMLFVYRIGAHVTIPAINLTALLGWFDSQKSSVLGFLDMFSGGAFRNASIFALGIMPYITASILLELLTVMVPYLERLKKEGEQGRKKITQYTRYLTLVFAFLQAFGIGKLLESLQSPSGAHIVTNPGFGFQALTILTMVTGTVVIMWIGEQITERGIGNGISLIIFWGIIVGLPKAIVSLIIDLNNGDMSLLVLIALLALMLAVTAAVVFFESGQRRVPTHYARRVQGMQGGAGQSSYLPLKVNVSGVIPIIFAQALVMFPQTLAQMFQSAKVNKILSYFGYGMPMYILIYIVAIVFFTFFYTSIIFNPVDTADNLKKYGAFVPGVRPGKATAEYLDVILTRLTFWGGIYLCVVSIIPMILMSGIHLEATPFIGKYLEKIIPEFITNGMGLQFYFGGTSLLIVVGVAMEFVSQVESHLLMRHYDGIMKKGRVRGRR